MASLLNMSSSRLVGNKVLPYDAEIEYLESTGTQWIDTGLNTLPAYDYTQFKYSMEVMFLKSTGRELMGTDGYNFFGKNGTKPEVLVYTHNINIVGTWAEYTVFTKRDVWGYGIVNGIKITGQGRYEANYPAYKICIFGIGKRITSTTLPSHLCTCRLKYFKIAENDIVVFDAIPVRVGQVGYMYDKVSGQLFGNAGTGAFILGADKTN